MGYTVALLGCREGSSEDFYQITGRNCARQTFQKLWLERVAPQRSLLRADCFLFVILILLSARGTRDAARRCHPFNDPAVVSLCSLKIRVGRLNIRGRLLKDQIFPEDLFEGKGPLMRVKMRMVFLTHVIHRTRTKALTLISPIHARSPLRTEYEHVISRPLETRAIKTGHKCEQYKT